jgi:phosphopantetheine adenylyltransferase
MTIDKNNGIDRNKLIQKLNEYKHRVEQLERYMETTKTNSTTIYINENSPYQQRRDSTDSEIIRTEEDDYNDRAKVNLETIFIIIIYYLSDLNNALWIVFL